MEYNLIALLLNNKYQVKNKSQSHLIQNKYNKFENYKDYKKKKIPDELILAFLIK